MKKLPLLLVVLFVVSANAYAAIGDYLITQPIGEYQIEKPPRQKPVTKKARLNRKPWAPFKIYSTAGPIQGTGHFNVDHNDTTYRVTYENDPTKMAVTVHVTQHPGADSDKWLFHEVEDSYRGDDLGLLSKGVRIRELDGNKYISMRGIAYTWVSNKVVVDVSYRDSDGTKPEPIEIIQAYLQKFPSTLQLTDVEFKSQAYNKQWIKDEMDRLLWLADKWYALIVPNDPEIGDKIKSVNSKLEDFLDYREKYFSVSAAKDKELLDGYFEADDVESLGKKLVELKAWWAEHKVESITLP